ncbi:hypothetical protein [Aureispira sp. CCB-E]|uniref:hypothetical protein n=1 Tax=Aureispira sp. CCB-E TaxID=3051121 RepID=UPI0028694733|nr:hypothetical protein [Aureispira sp. CCB-E]WMX14624.1 hypothetical protein QP953_27580 [Aureispira sp. CCB-E]
MDKLTQRLLGIAAIIFAFAFLIRSFSPVQANHAPQTTYGTGKYMMQMEAVMGDGVMNWYYVVWDTETGRSKFYYGNKGEGILLASSHYTLPSSPL